MPPVANTTMPALSPWPNAICGPLTTSSHVGDDLPEVDLAVRELPPGQRPSRIPVGGKPQGSKGVAVAHEYPKLCCGGSPIWIRFELLRTSWRCDRTCGRGFSQSDKREALTRVHGGHPVWTRLELAVVHLWPGCCSDSRAAGAYERKPHLCRRKRFLAVWYTKCPQI